MHLDALRGAAALIVFVNHTRALYFAAPLSTNNSSASISNVGSPTSQAILPALHPKSNELLHGTVNFGGEAVIIFFVLSGYLVGGGVLRALREDSWSWSRYLLKRLTRLYVVLVPALVLTKLLDTLGLRMAREGSVYFTTKGIGLIVTLGLRLRLGMLDLLGNLLFVQDIRVPEFGTNVALWSLANEFWYYVIFPLGLLALLDKKSSKVKRISFAIMAVALLVFVGPKIELLFPTWILGAVLVLLPHRLSPAAARWGTLLGATALVMTMVLVRALNLMPLVADYALAIVSCAAVSCMVQHRSRARDSVYQRAAAFFSNISYSLYLFHLPLSIFLCGFINNPWRPWRFTFASLCSYLAVDAMVLLAVYVLWRLFERNTDWFRRRVFES